MQGATTEKSSNPSCFRIVSAPWSKLNILPATSVLLVMSIVTICASYFLSEYVVDIVRSEAVFALGAYIVFASYFVFHYFLEEYSSSYKAVDKDKKFYVLSNLIKSSVLASITPFAVYLLYEALVLDIWRTHKIRNLGCLYAIPDFVSLLLVRRMSKTTTIHHICVCLFNYASMNNDYQQENVCRLIVVYAIFSTLAYLVNLLLGSRFLGVSQTITLYLSIGSLVIYLSACSINWSWQIWYIYRLFHFNNHWSIYMYCVALVAVIYDDLVLNKWLYKNIIKLRNPIETYKKELHTE